MNILDKNILTVVMATLISSGIIVITGNSIAEEKVEVSTDKTVSLKQVDVATKKLKMIKEQKKEVVAKGSTTVNANALLSPPPGPFYNKGGASYTQKALSAPIAPKEPINSLKKPTLEQRANSLHFNLMPVIAKKVVEPKGDLSSPIAPVKPSTVPKLVKKAPKIVQKIEGVSISSQTPKQEQMLTLEVAPPIMPKSMAKQPKMKPVGLPIWMQKGNISGENLNASSKNITKKNQAVMGMPNMGWGNAYPYPAQQYIYIPVPMMPSNMMPPQMPMFNHNRIPPSNYWAVPQLPNNTQGTVMKKGSVEGVSAPVQKGNK
jgi:hypothetical protein